MKEQEQPRFSRNGYQSNFCWYFVILILVGTMRRMFNTVSKTTLCSVIEPS